ncbi:MAG: methyltransferase [Brachybacterium sp.]|nr:methyltransferase [Brachybacterium sp.]
MPPPDATPQHRVVLEVLEGCGPFAAREAAPLGPVREVGPTELELETEDLLALRSLRRTVAAYLLLEVPARRPRELCATQNLQRLAASVETLGRLRPRMRFTGVRLSAAGADTPEMRRVGEEIGKCLGLPTVSDGDLLVRLRRGPGETWQMLIRTTPRPLSTRPWRTEEYPGAVNATIAASVLDLLDVGAEDQLLDLTCGTGTFLIEQLHDVAPARSVGVDISPAALEIARIHQRAARRPGRIDWTVGNVLEVPIEGGFTRLVTNPPWGMLHGDHASTQELHAALLRRAAELAAPSARLGVLTHEIRRMRAVLAEEPSGWRAIGEHRFFQKGHHPRLFLLERA